MKPQAQQKVVYKDGYWDCKMKTKGVILKMPNYFKIDSLLRVKVRDYVLHLVGNTAFLTLM